MPFFTEENKLSDNYLSKMHRNLDKSAENLLSGLIRPSALRAQAKKRLKILVPCAGTFPSYKTFLKVLKERYSELRMINLVLVDPVKAALDAFERLYPLPKRSSIIEIASIPTGIILENRTIFHLSLKEFIMMTTEQFDLVYMEHPQIGAADTCFFSQSRSLRSTIPYLSKVLKPDADVIVACQNSEEKWQIKRLLTYSFNLTSDNYSCSVRGSLVPVWPKCHSNGITVSNISTLNEDQQKARSKDIKLSDHLLWVFAIFSLALYLLTNFNKGKTFIAGTASLLLFFSQFALHHPGAKGLAVKISISALRLSLFINQLVHAQDRSDFNIKKLGL